MKLFRLIAQRIVQNKHLTSKQAAQLDLQRIRIGNCKAALKFQQELQSDLLILREIKKVNCSNLQNSKYCFKLV